MLIPGFFEYLHPTTAFHKGRNGFARLHVQQRGAAHGQLSPQRMPNETPRLVSEHRKKRQESHLQKHRKTLQERQKEVFMLL